MMNYCLEAGIPSPNYSFEGSDFLVEFRKDIYHEEYLLDLGLNERQIEALLFFKPSRVITSSIYQEKFEISERTARYDLVNLVERRLLLKIGDKKSTKYEYI